MSRTLMLWLVWLSLSVPAGLLALAAIVYGGNRSFLLIGRTTDGHHQIELACDACHTSLFGGREVLQDACVKCHGAELKAANDAHPQSKFTDPRNADRTAVLDARFCVTCHREHRPAITRAMGVTLPDDYCVLCHNDIAEDRPSHSGLAFSTCGSAGCHNFHDNRALYQEFLVKHGSEPAQLETQQVALAAWLARKEDAIRVKRPLAPDEADAPAGRADADVTAAWARDVHARGGVNCRGCHAAPEAPQSWIAAPGFASCNGCHRDQVRTFTDGRHGMRLRDGLLATRDGPFGVFTQSRLPPMSPAAARLPMKTEVRQAALGCNSCHAAHDYGTRRATTEACAGCHDDQHTRAYFSSPHYELWKKELAGALPSGSGVSCATCHMPVSEGRDPDGAKTIFVTHNQNDNLRPNEKMVRSVCGQCHGLQFTLDALADPALVRSNFARAPSVRIDSIEWAKRRENERRRHRM
jgi:hypothetical protein